MADQGARAARARTRLRSMWRETGTERPGNDALSYRLTDFIIVIVMLVVLAQIGGGPGVLFAFIGGWQFFWLGRIRAVRKERRDAE